jgi:antibiotic biosynthesis monooxygenase (ABM) superfamily enzyme
MSDRMDSPAAAAVMTKLRFRPETQAESFTWQARLTAAVAAFPGFLSIETVPVLSAANDWRIIQRFRTAEQLQQWCRSDSRRHLLAQARPLLDGDGSSDPDHEEAPDFHAQNSVTEVITTRVRPGMEGAFLDWSARIQEAQARFPGFRGIYLQPPSSDRQDHWVSLLRFALPEQLDAWLASSERRNLVRESEALVESWQNHRLPTAFAGWFPAEADGKPPATWKQTMLVLLALFPIVMLELRFLSPWLAGLNPALGTFIGNALSVSLVTWPMMPLAIRALDWWLRPRKSGGPWITVLGIAVLLGLYAAELALTWHLL